MGRIPHILKINLSLLILVNMVLTRNVSAQYNLDELKAAYIERITRFVEWPDSEIINKSDTIVFGFANDKKFEQFAINIFKTQKIIDRPVKIISVNNKEDLGQCQLCYVGHLNVETLNSYISLSNKNKILLFGHSDGYAALGIHINFYIEENKLKFEISRNSTQTAGFKISHLLLKTARII
jgi:hypothetical protein